MVLSSGTETNFNYQGYHNFPHPWMETLSMIYNRDALDANLDLDNFSVLGFFFEKSRPGCLALAVVEWIGIFIILI